MTELWVLEGAWVVPGIVHPPGTRPPTTPGTPPHPHRLHGQAGPRPHRHDGGVNMVVGLISVGQVSLSVHFSGLPGITEGYNVAGIGRINNHFLIPGNK